MAYSEYIKSAIDFLLKMQNDDGGIKISNRDSKISGIWTTAESLDAIITSNFLSIDISIFDEIIRMMDYLKTKFIVCAENPECGYWEIAEGRGASTMTTGHSIRALQICLNKVFHCCDIKKITLSTKEIVVADFVSDIKACIDKAVRWLQFQQQVDGGWSYADINSNEKSSILATYYVLLGLNCVGKNCGNDSYVSKSCLFIKRIIENILETKQYSQDSLAEILYAYPCLYSSGYFTQSDTHFKTRMMKFINHHWREIKSCMAVHDLHHKTIPFINNLPYIALNAVLTVEDYTYETKIRKLIAYFVSQRKLDGSWGVLKNDVEDTTWVTAEAILALSQVQHTYQTYYNKIVASKQIRLFKVSSIALGLICSLFLLYYFFTSVIPTGTEPANIDYWKTIPSFIFGVLGAATSIFSIIDIVKKR